MPATTALFRFNPTSITVGQNANYTVPSGKYAHISFQAMTYAKGHASTSSTNSWSVAAGDSMTESALVWGTAGDTFTQAQSGTGTDTLGAAPDTASKNPLATWAKGGTNFLRSEVNLTVRSTTSDGDGAVTSDAYCLFVASEFLI